MPGFSDKKCPLIAPVVLTLAAVTAACGSPTSPDPALDVGDGVALPGGSTLLFQDAGRLGEYRERIEQVVRDTLTTVAPLLPVDRVTVVVRAGAPGIIPEIGMGGRAEGGTVQLTFDPDSPLLAAALDVELFPMFAHELHHVARMRSVGYGDHLLGAMVSEGLADQFAVEVAGITPPRWAVALDADELAVWSSRARQQWFDTGYDHAAWFFGGGGIPRWAGYSIGFALTGEFLSADPSRRASTLFAEPASSFVLD